MQYNVNADTSPEWQFFEALHTGRETFFTPEEYAMYVGDEAIEELLATYGTWIDVCQSSGLDLQLPEIYVNPFMHTNEMINRAYSPTDFSENELAVECLLDHIYRFAHTQGKFPTIDDARHASTFPNVNHYLETFGTWKNACKEIQIKGLKPESLETELHHTVAYYNTKMGHNDILMTKEDWDKMSQENSKIPSSYLLKKYSGYTSSEPMYDPTTGKRITNEWQAIAVKADLKFDGRGRPKVVDDLRNTKITTTRFIEDCMSEGKILGYEEWVAYCHKINPSLDSNDKFLPASYEELNKHIIHTKNPDHPFRGLALLQQRALSHFKKNPENGQMFQRNRDIRERNELLKQGIDARIAQQKMGISGSSAKEVAATSIHDKFLQEATPPKMDFERNIER